MTVLDKLFWAELKSAKATTRSVAICYALLMGQENGLRARTGGQSYRPRDWTAINTGVMSECGGMAGLERVKKMAWEINDAVARVDEVAA